MHMVFPSLEFIENIKVTIYQDENGIKRFNCKLLSKQDIYLFIYSFAVFVQQFWGGMLCAGTLLDFSRDKQHGQDFCVHGTCITN